MINFIHKNIYKYHTRDVPKFKFLKQELENQGYMSQYGQDKYINETLLKNKDTGVFIDIGANDGVSLSNTWFFEKKLKWSGIAIEPLPNTFKKLEFNRSCTLINACISDTDGEVRFMVAEMLSGIIDKYDPRHIKRIKKRAKKFDDTIATIIVSSYKLPTLLKDTSFNKIDYMSIDTEGGELEILKNIDLIKTPVEIISVENNYYDTKFRYYMDSIGYDLVAIIGDEIYKRR